MDRGSALHAAIIAAGATFAPNAAAAVDFSVDGYADLRVVAPSNQASWQDGGLGKLRFGAGHGNPDFNFAEAAAELSALITPELIGVATARIAPKQYTAADLLDGYLRYRRVSISPFRWSIKAGAFFPPVSLENTEIGWTSPWTLTPSAINSWIGEEVRIIGSEASVEWRSDVRTLSLSAALFGWNQPSGELLADRGWSFSDAFSGVFDHPRLPDVEAKILGRRVPLRTEEFVQLDNRPGWYLAANWDEAGIGKLNVIFYDNNADASANDGNSFAWRAQFENAGLSTQLGSVTLLAQAMLGQTLIRPSTFFSNDTHFSSAYVLAGWSIDENWRAAVRVDGFATEAHTPFVTADVRESGSAVTAAIDYLPAQWLRLTIEGIRVDSTRSQRTLAGINPREVENQLQLSARLYLP